MAKQQVFISYAWGGESETVANEVEAVLRQQGIDLVRDKTDLGFKGLIREFMQKISEGNFVVLIISDKYLKSKNCMFELMEVEKKGEFFDRIFPIVLPDANIYDSLGILGYLKYWDQKIKDLNASAKELDNLADTRKVQEDINLYTDIRGAIDDLAGKLSNMNTLTVEIMRAKNYQPLVESLLAQGGKTIPQTQAHSSPSKKEGKVLYHIPGMMQVNSWTRCTVRLAWEEIILTEGLKIPEDQRVIESIRLGSVMQVSLNEGRDGHNFEINPLNNEEQFIAEDDFTEWLFDVKALNSGNFTLILRVTLIQIIEGKERKKDVVLERNVVTEAVVPKALAQFETAEGGLIPPRLEREGTKLSDLEQTRGAVIPNDQMITKSPDEFEEDWKSQKNTDHTPPVILTQIPTIPSATSAAPGKPQSKTSNFRKILPYAASVAVLFIVGTLFFSEFNSEENMASAPDGSIDYSEEVTMALPPEEKMLVALSLESTTPSGEQVVEVMAFMVNEGELEQLALLNPGDYSLQVFPASDTSTLNLGSLQEYSILEIQDSVQKAAVQPARVDGEWIERNQLQINPELQIIRTQPQQLDSAVAKKLRRNTFVRRGN